MRKFVLLVWLAMCMTAIADVHRVGTYNIRFPSSEDKDEKAWDKRKAALATMIRDTMNYDVIALQEVSNSTQLDYLKGQMPAYTFYMGSYYGATVAYRTAKYTCLDKGVYYLAPDPTKSGKAWDAQQTRWTVWTKLQDKQSGDIFFFAATHLDLYPISIREGARVNAEQMRKIAGNYPVMIAGDMNCEPGDRDPHANYRQYLGNARDMSKTTPKGSYYTFASGMDPGTAKQKLIDFMYVRNVEVESYYVNNSTLGRSLMPSDHMPVLCEIRVLPQLHATTHVVSTVEELRQAAREVQPDDIIYLNAGTYDLGNQPLELVNTCVIESSEDAVITGHCQLLAGTSFLSLELRGVHIADARSETGVYGSIVHITGNYLTMTDCTIERCETNGSGLVYANDCKLTMDHCVFKNNVSSQNEGCLMVVSDQSGYTHPLTLTRSSFIQNTAYQAPALYLSSEYTAYIANNGFVANEASQRGCISIDAATNTSDIRVVNNTFVRNRIATEASRADALVGGSAIWQEMAEGGCLSLVNNTIVGNYTASWTAEGMPSAKFNSGAVHSKSGRMKVYNNIIAGNYSSATGRGDLSLEDPTSVEGGYNVLSSASNTNYTLARTDVASADYASALQALVKLYGGVVEDSVYHAPWLVYGEQQDVWGLSPLTTYYAGQNIAILNETVRSASTIGSDILNTGAKTGVLTLDQGGATRNAYSVAGAMEAGQLPTSLTDRFPDSPIHQLNKVIINNQIYIIYEDKMYNLIGMPVCL